MPKQIKQDGVIEAVHYRPDGQIAWVRAYLRRGPIWSDHVLLDRQTLVEHLKAGKKYASGVRQENMGSMLNVERTISLVQSGGRDVLTTGAGGDKDTLEGVPQI